MFTLWSEFYRLQMWQRLPWNSEVQVHLTSSNEVKSGGTHTPPFLQGHLSISGTHEMRSEVIRYTVCVSVCVLCVLRVHVHVCMYVL